MDHRPPQGVAVKRRTASEEPCQASPPTTTSRTARRGSAASASCPDHRSERRRPSAANAINGRSRSSPTVTQPQCLCPARPGSPCHCIGQPSPGETAPPSTGLPCARASSPPALQVLVLPHRPAAPHLRSRTSGAKRTCGANIRSATDPSCQRATGIRRTGGRQERSDSRLPRHREQPERQTTSEASGRPRMKHPVLTSRTGSPTAIGEPRTAAKRAPVD